MAFTHALSTNNYGPAKIIVATSASNGTHTTLATAMADAVSGDTIFLRNSVTENVTITPGVNITAWSGGTLNTPSITGTLTMTGAGTSTISGLELITNSAAIIAVTGSAASFLNITDCYLNCSNNSGITFSAANTSAAINIKNCNGDLGTTGIKFFAHTSTGALNINLSRITNSGGSLTASTASAGSLVINYCVLSFPITTSSTSGSNIYSTSIDLNGINTKTLILGGSGSQSLGSSYFSSGTATCITATTTVGIGQCNINTTNATAAIDGAGTLNYNCLTFGAAGQNITTSTQNGGSINGIQPGRALTAGYLGEQITSAVTTVSLSNTVAKTITSINLTSGIWDISGLGTFNGSTNNLTDCVLSISTTNNTLAGNLGDLEARNASGLATVISLNVPVVRATLSSTVTYYLVGQANFGSGTVNGQGRITATRVG